MRRADIAMAVFVLATGQHSSATDAADPYDFLVLRGRAADVVDGRTFDISTGKGRKVRVSLAGLSVPAEPAGLAEASKAALARLVDGRPVELRMRSPVRYWIKPGQAVVDGKTDAGLAQVENGMAVVDRGSLACCDPAYLEAEARAMKSKAGLWASVPQKFP